METQPNNTMATQLIVTALLIGLAAGMLSGLVGVGGGIVIVPALVYFLGFSQHTAQGTSLGLIMLPVGILGFLQYYYSSQKAGTPINFYVIGIEDYPSSELEVFNRWGDLVYENKDYKNEWHGESKDGKSLPDDTYYYVLKLGEEKEIKNFVIIKR